MKVFISFDMEGVAGIVDWEQCVGFGPAYEIGQRLTLEEVNAAIDGALEGGATEIVVNDSHWTMQNLPPDALRGEASYISGRHKPDYMMQGLDDSFDAVFFVGYHGSISGDSSVLSHTYNPATIGEVRLGGEPTGEAGINALVAMRYGVPIALITGDAHTAEQAGHFMPDAERVVVKDSITRFAAHNIHPEAARRLIREGAARAAAKASSLGAPALDLPARLEIDFLNADMAEIATWIRGVERTGTRTATIEGDDPLEVFRSFVGVTYLTRQVEGR